MIIAMFIQEVKHGISIFAIHNVAFSFDSL